MYPFVSLAPVFLFLLKWYKSTSENPFSEGEAHFWRCHFAFGATLTDVWWKMHIFFFMGMSVELMKSQGDFPHKWIFGNRHISCSSRVCFKRGQNGVDQTPLIISSNEHKLLTWLQFDTILLDTIVKNNGAFTVMILKICCISWASGIFHLWRPSF